MVVLLWTSNYLSNQSELYVNILLLSILITWIFCKMRLTMTISVTVKCNHNFPVGWSFIIRRFPPRRVCCPHVGCYRANSVEPGDISFANVSWQNPADLSPIHQAEQSHSAAAKSLRQPNDQQVWLQCKPTDRVHHPRIHGHGDPRMGPDDEGRSNPEGRLIVDYQLQLEIGQQLRELNDLFL